LPVALRGSLTAPIALRDVRARLEGDQADVGVAQQRNTPSDIAPKAASSPWISGR
jgi:hypothetical protein